MSWGEPLWLWALAAPAAATLVLAFLPLLLRRSQGVRWPRIGRVVASGAGLRPLSPRAARRPWLLLLALALSVVALARPRWGDIEEPVFEQAREVMIALDLSRSMLAQDVPPARLARAALMVQALLDGLRGERVGLIVFAGTAFVQVPLSADYQILDEFLPELKPDYMPQGGTDYAGMLRAALGGFSETANTDRYLIVLSDGESLAGDWRAQLEPLRRRGVRAIALGIGTTAGAFIPDGHGAFIKDERGAVVLSRLEPATLQELASETGGAYRDASAWVDLPALLAETVARGRQGRFSEKRDVRQIERFQWFLAPAVVLALLGLWREIPVRPRLRAIAHRASPEAGSTGNRAAAAAIFAALLIALPSPAGAAVSVRPAPPSPPPAPPAATDPAAQVREMVEKLANGPAPAADDWRRLAEATLIYGRDLRSAGRPVDAGPVRDALEAVDRGEKARPDAADWEKLRKELEELLEPPPPPPPEEQQDQPQQSQQQQDQPRDQPQNEPQGASSPPNQDGQPPPQNQNPDTQPSPPAAGEGQPPPARPQPPAQPPQQAPAGGRIGELAEQPPAAAPPPPPDKPEKTRRFGGRPAGEPQPPTDPELAAALQRLRQIGERDSPARLHELLEGDSEQAAPVRGRDW